jgi:hypothetical protein
MIPPAPWVNGEGVQWEDLGEPDSENILLFCFPTVAAHLQHLF